MRRTLPFLQRKRKTSSLSDTQSNSRSRSRSIGSTRTRTQHPKPTQSRPPVAASSLRFEADKEDTENKPPGYNSKSQIEKDIINASALRTIKAKSKTVSGRAPHKWFDNELEAIKSSEVGNLLNISKTDIQYRVRAIEAEKSMGNDDTTTATAINSSQCTF